MNQPNEPRTPPAPTEKIKRRARCCRCDHEQVYVAPVEHPPKCEECGLAMWGAEEAPWESIHQYGKRIERKEHEKHDWTPLGDDQVCKNCGTFKNDGEPSSLPSPASQPCPARSQP